MAGDEDNWRVVFVAKLAAKLNASYLAKAALAFHMGKPGSEIQAPMAIVILFGLLSSTALNMVVVPSLYARFGGKSQPDRLR